MLSKVQIREIANKYYKDIYLFCLSRTSSNEAEDIAQEVFLIFQKKSPLLEEDNIRSWLLSVAKNLVYEQYRKQKKEINILSYDDNMFNQSDGLLYEMDEEENLSDEEVERAKGKLFGLLTKDERELLKMIYIDRIKYREILEILGTTENVIRVRAFRLRSKVKKLCAKVLVGVILVVLLLVL